MFLFRDGIDFAPGFDESSAYWVLCTAFFWIFGGIAALALIGSVFSKSSSGSVSPERPRTRIDIPHYYDEDEYVCTICGTRFDTDTMTCPHCGVRFNSTKTDDRAFIEEEDEEEWWDEMEEEKW